MAMRKQEIEAWALRVLERIGKGQAAEDAQVEVKSAWPPPDAKIARRIAGHCNASRGEPVLWLIGVDEKSGVVAFEPKDPADWWPQCTKHFDGTAPGVIDVACRYNKQPFVAMLFVTDQAPYVVKCDSSKGVQDREVPWREATAVRSARRHELIGMYDASPWRGSAWAYNGKVSCFSGFADDTLTEPACGFDFELCVYFEHHGGGRLSLPLPRAVVGVLPPNGNAESAFRLKQLWTFGIDDVGPESSSQVAVERSGSVGIGGRGIMPQYGLRLPSLRIALSLRSARDEPVITVIIPVMHRPEAKGLPIWAADGSDEWLDAINPTLPFPTGLEQNRWFKVGPSREPQYRRRR